MHLVGPQPRWRADPQCDRARPRRAARSPHGHSLPGQRFGNRPGARLDREAHIGADPDRLARPREAGVVGQCANRRARGRPCHRAGKLISALPLPNDGVVSTEETRVPGRDRLHRAAGISYRDAVLAGVGTRGGGFPAQGKFSMRRLLGVLALFACLPGCTSIGYYYQAVEGQMQIWHRSRPIKQVIDDAHTPEQIRDPPDPGIAREGFRLAEARPPGQWQLPEIRRPGAAFRGVERICSKRILDRATGVVLPVRRMRRLPRLLQPGRRRAIRRRAEGQGTGCLRRGHSRLLHARLVRRSGSQHDGAVSGHRNCPGPFSTNSRTRFSMSAAIPCSMNPSHGGGAGRHRSLAGSGR